MNIEYTHVPCRTFSLWLPNGGRRIVNQIQTEEWPDLAAPEGPRWHILKLSSNLKNQGFLSTSSTGLRTFKQWPMLRLKVLRSVMGLKALDFNQVFFTKASGKVGERPGPMLVHCSAGISRFYYKGIGIWQQRNHDGNRILSTMIKLHGYDWILFQELEGRELSWLFINSGWSTTILHARSTKETFHFLQS